MHTQAHLNPTELSILSIPRENCWIFASPILRLLHYESLKVNRFNTGYESDFSTEEGEDEADEVGRKEEYEQYDDDMIQQIITGLSSSWCIPKSGKRSNFRNESMSHMSSSGYLEKSGLQVDNSSKVDPQRDAFDSSDESIGSDSLRGEDKGIENAEHDDNYFFHIAFTPIECTVICSSHLMKKLFEEPLNLCQQLNYDKVKLIDESFLSLLIDSDGSFDNSSQILELTKPLSENDISLFFLSSHFSNIVLIPYNLKEKVIAILSKQNFEFSDISNSYVVSQIDDNREQEDVDISQEVEAINLESKAFQLLKQTNIQPRINSNANLLLTGARPGEVKNTILKAAKNISSGTIPEYFSITRTSVNEVSLLLPKSPRKRSLMGFSSKNIIGSIQDVIIPITVDLYKLPLDSTGIVAGLASKIINGVKLTAQTDYPFEMNYLSMAQSAIIMVPKENLSLVSDILSNVSYD